MLSIRNNYHIRCERFGFDKLSHLFNEVSHLYFFNKSGCHLVWGYIFAAKSKIIIFIVLHKDYIFNFDEG